MSIVLDPTGRPVKVETPLQTLPKDVPAAALSCHLPSGRGDRHVAKLSSMFGKPGELVYIWHERGLIKWYREMGDGTDKNGAMLWQKMVDHTVAIRDMLKISIKEIKHSNNCPGAIADEIDRMQKFLEAICRVLDEARRFGGPVERGLIRLSKHFTEHKKLYRDSSALKGL